MTATLRRPRSAASLALVLAAAGLLAAAGCDVQIPKGSFGFDRDEEEERDDDGEGSGGRREGGDEGGGGAGGVSDEGDEPACSHDVDQEGPALDSSCGECAALVCAADSYCCTVSWDDACVDLVQSACQGGGPGEEAKGIGDACSNDDECASGLCWGWCTATCATEVDCYGSHDGLNEQDGINSCMPTDEGNLCFPDCSDEPASYCDTYGGTTCMSFEDTEGYPTNVCSG